MVVTFCGHRDFQESVERRQALLDYLEKRVGDNSAELLLGIYGNFDSFAYACCKEYKKQHANVRLIACVPYLDEHKISELSDKFDSIIYPEIENKPRKFAIFYCNRYMVNRSGLLIAYVTRTWGGAYATYKFAKGQGKEIFNLSQSTF